MKKLISIMISVLLLISMIPATLFADVDQYQLVRDELGKEFGVTIRPATAEELAKVGLALSEAKLPSIEVFRETLRQEIIDNITASLQSKRDTVRMMIMSKNRLNLSSPLRYTIETVHYAVSAPNCYLHVSGKVLHNGTEATHWNLVQNAWSETRGVAPWFVSEGYSTQLDIYDWNLTITYSGFLVTSNNQIIEQAERTATLDPQGGTSLGR